MRPIGRSIASTIMRFGTRDAVTYDEGAQLVEMYLDTGIPFGIDRLGYGHTSLDLAIPMKAYARTGAEGPVIRCERMPLYGCGRTAREAFREFSVCAMSAVRVFCAEDSPDPELGRRLAYHVKGRRSDPPHLPLITLHILRPVLDDARPNYKTDASDGVRSPRQTRPRTSSGPSLSRYRAYPGT